MWLESTFRVFHLLDHVLVETEAKRVFVIDKRLQDEVQAFLDNFQVFDVVSLL